MDMEYVSTRDMRLGQGVLAAVLHVAAAGARGPRELAMELDAARGAVKSKTGCEGYAAPFDAAFSQHLSRSAFAELLERPRSSDLALESLHASVELLEQAGDPELLT